MSVFTSGLHLAHSLDSLHLDTNRAVGHFLSFVYRSYSFFLLDCVAPPQFRSWHWNHCRSQRAVQEDTDWYQRLIWFHLLKLYRGHINGFSQCFSKFPTFTMYFLVSLTDNCSLWVTRLYKNICLQENSWHLLKTVTEIKVKNNRLSPSIFFLTHLFSIHTWLLELMPAVIQSHSYLKFVLVSEISLQSMFLSFWRQLEYLEKTDTNTYRGYKVCILTMTFS